MWYTRVVKTGEVLGAAHSAQQDADWLTRYGAALGITDPLEMFETGADPRPVNAKAEPAPTPEPPTLEARIAAIERDVADLNPGGAVAASLRG